MPYVLTLLILVITCRPGTTVSGSPGELSSTRIATCKHRQGKHHDGTLRSTPTLMPGRTTATCSPTTPRLIVIDMQTDFCGKGGYVDVMGYDLSLTQAPIEPLATLLAGCAPLGFHIIHTREGHRPDLSDLPANKRWRSRQIGTNGVGIGDAGPCGRILVRGEPGWEIIPELAPLPGEVVIDKPGKGSFYATDLETGAAHTRHRNLILRHHHRRVRAHHDARRQRPRLRMPAAVGLHRRHRPGNHEAALKMITMQGGVFGAHATSALLATLASTCWTALATP
jgi:nicotinamidase-related amidase